MRAFFLTLSQLVRPLGRAYQSRVVRQWVLMAFITLLFPLAALTQPAAAPPVDPKLQQMMNGLVMGYRNTQALYIAAKLGLADQLATGAKSADDLAAATGTKRDPLYRVLRLLAGLGVFSEEPDGRFRLLPPGQLLRSGVPGSVKGSATVAGEPFSWDSWGALLHTVKTGETGFDSKYGKNTFDWFSEHPEEARLFDQFQGELTERLSGPIVRAYDWSGAGTIVDVGGGDGTLLRAVLRDSAKARGVVFDLAHVTAAAKTGFPPDLIGRTQFAGGNFFESVPSGGDLYLMKYIIHDWNDAQSLEILQNTRKAMAPSSKLLLIEDLVCAPNVTCAAKSGDLAMMVRTGGRNRTEAEYRLLLERAGFKVLRTIPVIGDLAMIECSPGR